MSVHCDTISVFDHLQVENFLLTTLISADPDYNVYPWGGGQGECAL